MDLHLPIVTIITPYYNTGTIFHETAQSVFAQTLDTWEWLIVNDGSNDPDALVVLERYRTCDPRVRVVDQPNQGLPGARNTGVALSHAPLLFFLDSDDHLAPNALEQFVEYLAINTKAAFVTSWVQAFGAKSFLWQRGFESGNLFLFENTVTPLAMVRRSVFEATNGFNERRTGGLEDYEFWIRCAAQGYWGSDIPVPLVFQRHKRDDEYIHYRWANRDEPAKLRAFQDEMRHRYPLLYREGVPQLHATGKAAHVYAYERIGLWLYPLTRWLHTHRQRLINSSAWRVIGPVWRRAKGRRT